MDIDGYDEIIKDFLAECHEHLDNLDNGFVMIEQENSDKKTLSEIFRSMHTIKGGAGMLAFPNLEKLTHAAENLMSLLRDGKLELTSEMVTVLLQTVDAIRMMLDSIAQTGADGSDNYDGLIETLNSLLEPKKKSKKVVEKVESEPLKVEEPPVVEESNQETQEQIIIEEPVITASADGIKPEPSATIAAPQTPPPMEDKPLHSDTTIRVNVELLDKLMNLIGELVLSRNQILQFNTDIADSNFIAVSQRLNLITSELQEGVMKMRMQPIGNVWGKFNRIVRDLAVTCNKKVNLELFGKETELDKTLIEAIKDPLTHIVRNSVDHGIELAEVRKSLGKPEEGVISLKAFHESGHVNIEIYDDGGGISATKVKEKALSKGLISAEQAARMTEREALNLIFLPGLSTAEKITNVSGRGVGMDVVRTNIERINGTIDVQSKPGFYTLLKIKIPLTLAIIPALIVTCQENRYAIPQISLLELVRLEGEQIKGNIQYIKDIPVYKLRGKLLPLVYLDKELELEINTIEKSSSEFVNIVVLNAGEIQFGLVVDGVSDTQEIVVKPLSKLLRNQQAFAGATIMGDGKISLILDVMGIARKAGLLSSSGETNKLKQTLSKAEKFENEKQQLLLLRAGTSNVMAVPLNKVNRIEEFFADNIENVGSQEVVQYRDSIMPLVRLGHVVQLNKNNTLSNDSKIQVIVHSNGVNNFGLIVDQVYDIVEGSFTLHQRIKRNGILGTSIINEKVTEIIDLDTIIGPII